MKSKKIKFVVGIIVFLICFTLLQGNVLALTEDEYVASLKERYTYCFTNSSGEDLTNVIKTRCASLIAEYIETYNSYNAFLGGASHKSSGTDFIAQAYLMCLDYGNGVGFDVGTTYETKKKELDEMGILLTDAQKISKIRKAIEVDIANFNQLIFYSTAKIAVTEGKVTQQGGNLTENQIIELIYVMAHGVRSKKTYGNTIAEYNAAYPWSDDTNSQTVWGIMGSVTRNTMAEEAKKYREDIVEFAKEHTSTAQGTINGSEITATVQSPINFKSDAIESVKVSGNATFDPTLQGNVGKGDNVTIKIPYEEGKTSYEIEVTYDYKTYDGSCTVYFNGKYVGSTNNTTQRFINTSKFEESGGGGSGKWKIIITTTPTPTPTPSTTPTPTPTPSTTPTPTPTPTPSTTPGGGEGEPTLEIEKKVVYVFSDYEGNTSGEDVYNDQEDAKVQRGDEVVFKITITNTSQNSKEYYKTPDDFDDVDYKTPTSKPTCPSTSCHTTKTTSTNNQPSGDTHDVEYYKKENQRIKCVDSFYLKSFDLKDEIVYVKNLSIFNGTSPIYGESASIPGSNVNTGWDTDTGNQYKWTTTDDKGLAPGESITIYLVGQVDKNWTSYGDEDINTATVTNSKFNKVTTRTLQYKKTTVTYTHKYTYQKKTKECQNYWHPWCGSDGWPRCNWKYTYYWNYNCSNTEKTDSNYSEDPLPDYIEEVDGNSDEDDAKIHLQGYGAEIEKELEAVVAQIHKANPTGDSGNDTNVEWGDLLEYKITVTNTGDNGTWETNFYEGLYVNDYFDESELKYVGDPDGDNYYGEDYSGDGINKIVWQDGPISGWDTSSSGTGKNYYKDDDNFGLGKGIEDGKEGLVVDDFREEHISTVVVSKPGGSVTNNADLIAIKNRNGVEIEMDVEPVKVTNEVRTYEAGVDKYVSKVTSEGLQCSESKTNEVADQYPIDDRKEKEDSDKESNPVMSDRGDKIEYTITFKNKSKEANIWKFKLTDEFDSQLEYLDKFESDASGTWTVNKDGGDKLTLIYVGNESQPGENLSNDSEWEKVDPEAEVSIKLYFQVVDGAEYSKKYDVYKNTVKIEQVWNRNSKHLVEGNITLDKQESSDWVKVRQLSASIDKYVSGLYGGIEGDVSNTINNSTRNRKGETNGIFDSQEAIKVANPVEVERGDEITYTITIRNNQPLDNSGGLISELTFKDTYDTRLIPCSFNDLSGGKVKLVSQNEGELEFKYTGHLLPEQEFSIELVFIMTKEDQDESPLYEETYKNTAQITELNNVNDWKWSIEGATNAHHDSCDFSGPCILSNLINIGGIRTDRESSDYVYMLAYAVELEKYIVNVKHTLDNGDTVDYNKDNGWASQSGDDVDREFWDTNELKKAQRKEDYPVQVEKGDIITYEIKISNKYNQFNGNIYDNENFKEIKQTTLEPTIYALDIIDIFNSEDFTTIGEKDVGLKWLGYSSDDGEISVINNISYSEKLLKFTPYGNHEGYGLESGQEAKFTFTVEVTRSNMYLYELFNHASITEVYNRNNNIGSYHFNSNTERPEGTNTVEYKVANGNRRFKNDEGILYQHIITWNVGDKTPYKFREDTKTQEDGVYASSVWVTDFDCVNLKDLIISGYVWDDTDVKNEEDGLMTWGVDDSNDRQVEGDVYVYLYRMNPNQNGIESSADTASLVMSTKVDENGYYIFGTEGTTVYENNDQKVLVNQAYRFEPTKYKTPVIKVGGKITKTSQDKEIYKDDFTNYRIVKAPNKDYGPNSTTKYDLGKYAGYYQYYIEFEYNGMKYTHTIYGTNSKLPNDDDGTYSKGTPGSTSNTEDGKYNLSNHKIDGDYRVRTTYENEWWLPWKKIELYRGRTNILNGNSEYYEIDSNAAEFKAVREAFNDKFATISYNQGWDEDGNATSSLSYTKSGHVSSLNYTNELKMRARSFVTNWENDLGNTNKEDPRYTETLFFWNNENNRTRNTYENKVGTTEETEYLKYINLGLKQRPSLDLELTKDVYDVQVDINEKTMVYDYSSETIDRGQLSMFDRTGVNENGEVILDKSNENSYTQDEVLNDNNQNHLYYYNTNAGYQKTGYQLNMYYSDWAYRFDDYANDEVKKYKYNVKVANSEHNSANYDGYYNEEEYLKDEASHSELNVQITYKYTITNRSAYAENNKGETIIGAVKEIVDYYQSDLIPNSVGTYVINRNGKYTPVNGEYKNESGYVVVGYDSKYPTINGEKNEANIDGKGSFKTCYIKSVTDKIEKTDYTDVIGATGHSKEFELENERLYPGDSVDIYLTFTVSRQALNDNRKLDLDNKTKYNVAEINAFSSYYSLNEDLRTEWSRGLTTPGLVDKDSNPGNTPIDDLFNIDDYEDDTFKVDITTTLDHDARLIDGIVWEDVNYGSKGTAIGNPITQTQQIVGDGKYYAFRNNNKKMEDFDNLIGGIKVELIELITVVDGDTAIVYEDRANVKDLIDGKDQNIFDTESGKDGYYDIKGFIPGNYIVRFTYGNGTTKDKAYTTYQYKNIDDEIVESHSPNDNNDYNGQDYKSTQYQVGIMDNKTDDNYITNVWHDMISDSVNKVGDGIHISDARDDEVRRLEVIAYSRTINNEVAEILNTKDLKDTTFTDNTYMFADTAKLQIELEHLKYVESDEFENANGENNKDAKYNEVAIYHGKVDEGNNKGKFVVGTYYKIDAFGNRIPDKAYDENLNLNGNDEPNQHKIKYYDLNNNSAEGGLSQQLANYTHWVADIDFGMEQRPTTNISLHKMISGIKVTTADGEAIVEVEYEPTYDKNGAIATNIITGAEHIQHVANTANYSNSDDNPYNGVTKDIDEEVINKIPNIVKFISEKLIKNKQGFYYINIDEDLMQGAVVTVDYSISVTNESEVDTLGLLTGFKNGEQIYDETFAILAKDKDISTYTPNGIKLSEKYNYVDTRANNNIPTYKGGKLSITDDENNIDINNIGFKYGYYLGSTYYNGEYHKDTYVVETRIDQIIDYVDNDLTFREEDNSTENSTWRTVSLSELVEGEIQKDVVGQENSDNYYRKTKTVNYVPYNRANNTDKTIEVSNVGNMLADSVYRIRKLKATEKENGTTTTSNIESAIYYANVQGDVIKDGDEVYDVIKDTDGNITYKRRVTIMDDDAREYVTDQKKNIVLSVPEENPDMYTYLIPEKALDGTILADEFKNDDIEDIINRYITDHQEERINDNTKKAAINIWNVFRTYNKKSPITFKWFKNFTNIILNDDTITDIYNDDYKRAGRELLIQIVKEKYMIMQDEAKGTFNGENSEYKNDTVTYVRRNTQSSARINLKTTRTISPDTDTEDLSFENIAEIIQFSNESGRRDEYATVGDASIWKGAWKAATPPEDETDRSGETALVPEKENDEDGELSQYNRDKNNPKGDKIFTYDTDTTEVILLSPPTGVSQSQLVKIETQETIASIAVIVGSTIVVISLGIVLFRKATKKKFYK